MKKYNSVMYALCLASVLPMHELPIENRTDGWWDRFWQALAIDEASLKKDKI